MILIMIKTNEILFNIIYLIHAVVLNIKKKWGGAISLVIFLTWARDQR